MYSPIPRYLDQVLESALGLTDGAVADYIPQLAAADPEHTAIAIATVDGTVYARGDIDMQFSIQSMSKPFTYALALADRGINDVGKHVGVEPSGEAFNEISLEPSTGRPRNPMINAGAIATHGLVQAPDAETRLRRVVDFYSKFAGRELEVDEATAQSELGEGYRNIALGNLLRSFNVIDGDPDAIVEGYIRQCSVLVNVTDLVLMAATLANNGIQPRTGERVLERRLVREVLSVMMSSGMYDAAGDWLTNVGIPSKSGVSGGIIGVLPGQLGIAVFSPRLDSHGNSVRGVHMMEQLSEDMGMHLMNAARPARSALRDVCVDDSDAEPTTIYELHGDLILPSMESLLQHLIKHPPTTKRVVFNLSKVEEINDIARRMALWANKSLLEEGYEVVIEDTNGLLDGYKLPA